MKVLQVLPALNSGGVERGALEIAEALVRENHQSWVLSAGGKLVAGLEASGSTHINWDLGKKSPATLLQVFKLRRWLQQQQFDIVHLRSRMPAWAIWLAWRGMDKATRPRLVTTVHGLHSVSRYSEIVTYGERVIVVSKSVAGYLQQNYPRANPGSLDQNKIKLIYRGIDPQAFPHGYKPDKAWLDKWYSDYPQLKGATLVTLPARLTRLKGHLEFIDIIKSLKDRNLPIKALIVGDEDPKRQNYAQAVYQKVKALGLSDDIIFTGYRNDIKDIYGISDLVLSLSTKPESFGRSVLEPLSMGVPVVGYEHGGVGEILEALFPEGAVELMNIDAVVAAAEKQLSGKGEAIIKNDRFLLADMTRHTLNVYQELIASPRPA